MASPSLTDTSDPRPMSIEPSPQPPALPRPWRWQCHFCGHTYRLSCTRRCLSCSHRLCYSLGPLVGQGSSKKRPMSCKTDFDFYPWGELIEWRRDTLEYKTSPERWEVRTMALIGHVSKERPHWSGVRKMKWVDGRKRNIRKTRRISRFKDKTHDCTIDCSYPSECIREFLTAQRAEETEEESSDDDEATSTSNQETPSGTRNGCCQSQQGSPSSLVSYSGKPRRFRHLRWRRDTSGLNPLRQPSNPESPASPESP